MGRTGLKVSEICLGTMTFGIQVDEQQSFAIMDRAIEGGVDFAHDQQYPVSGLKGNLWRLATIGLSIGISSVAELQIDGGLYDRLDITHADQWLWIHRFRGE